jgi:prolyl oligopeptidase
MVLSMSAFAAAVTFASAGLVSGERPAAPPATEVRPVTDTLHGVPITDPYRWLEGDAKGEMTPDVATWTDAQNAHTRAVLDNLPGRKALEERLGRLMQMGSVSAPGMAGNRYFFTKREGTQNQAIVYVRDQHNGPDRVLLNPNTLDASGLVTISWTSPSQDGRLLAFGMYRAGDENSTLYLMDVDSGRWLADEIPGKVNSVSWLPDGTGFFYQRLADVSDPYSAQIKFHRVGTHHRQDPLLFRQFTKQENEQLATTWGPFFYTSRDGRWGVLGYWTSTSDNDLWIVDMDRWFRTGGPAGTGEFVKQPVMVGKKGRSFGGIVGDTMYLQTTVDAPSGRVLAVDLNNPAQQRVLIPERTDAVLESVSLARGLLVASYTKDVVSRMELFGLDGTPLGEVPLPGLGSAGVSVSDDRTEAFVSYTSFNEPPSIYRVDLAKPAERALWARPETPADPSIAEVKQVFFTSTDGTRVPMFIVHRKGLSLSGDNPTILYGYGGFNASESPFFSPTLFTWLEDGGVYAVANIRGGGEYGDAWHRAGQLGNKQNVFDDFASAAQWLIDNKYTRSERLGIVGGSNGGLLTGAMVAQRPELFAAAISAVPLLDMLRYQDFLMARYWVPEYGSAEDPEAFKWLRAYSPYHNIRPGVKYPAVLLTAGENDTRVHPLHARKMAALLQASTASDPARRPVLLWVDRDAGHGAGKPLNLRIRDAADSRIFFMWQLGMLEGK